jgi:hypothetical protein
MVAHVVHLQGVTLCKNRYYIGSKPYGKEKIRKEKRRVGRGAYIGGIAGVGK